jgi:molecular chaperone DnaJ
VCGGSGKKIKERCPDCGGNGLIKKEEVVTISIPAGVQEGMMLNMRGKGNDAPGGGVPGDLQIVIEEQRDEQLIRDEQDLIYNLMIDFPTAALGGKVEIPTVDGRARVTIEPGTQPGKVLRLRGKGLPSVSGYGKGDLLVNVMVYVPENLSASEKRTIESLRESGSFKPNSSTKERIFSRLRHMFD